MRRYEHTVNVPAGLTAVNTNSNNGKKNKVKTSQRVAQYEKYTLSGILEPKLYSVCRGSLLIFLSVLHNIIKDRVIRLRSNYPNLQQSHDIMRESPVPIKKKSPSWFRSVGPLVKSGSSENVFS